MVSMGFIYISFTDGGELSMQCRFDGTVVGQDGSVEVNGDGVVTFSVQDYANSRETEDDLVPIGSEG